jgi:ABC-type lipoprotein export system ATPase subunit
MANKYHQIDIAWNDLCCSAPSKIAGEGTIDILKNVSGCARAGQVTSIMGPSGAGKTTMVRLSSLLGAYAVRDTTQAAIAESACYSTLLRPGT